MDLSVVTTMYRSAPYLEEFYTRICSEAEKITGDYEIIFVNDGSPDNSLTVALSLYEQDHRVKVIDLSRNFGHHKAMMTGLAHARADLVFLIDCDLEEEPESLEKFYAEFNSSGADVVYGVQEVRKGGFFERISGAFFYRLFDWLTSYPVPSNQLTARLMKQSYVTNLVEHKENEVFIDGLWAITGYKQIPLMVKKQSKGTSTYTLRRKLSLTVNAITSFSNKPLIYIFYLGVGIVLLSVIAAMYLIARKLLYGEYLMGWPSLIVSVWLMGGLTFFCLGIIGIYLSKIFTETKHRPYTIIKNIYEQPARTPRQTLLI